MSYAALEKEIKSLNTEQQFAVQAFIHFLISRAVVRPTDSKSDASDVCGQKVPVRALGGFEKGFSMSADFDAPLACFAEYS